MNGGDQELNSGTADVHLRHPYGGDELAGR